MHQHQLLQVSPLRQLLLHMYLVSMPTLVTLML